jgi:hypothetical protein
VFRCDLCGRAHVALVSHAEALADFRRRQPLEAKHNDPWLIVCDRCYGDMAVPAATIEGQRHAA